MVINRYIGNKSILKNKQSLFQSSFRKISNNCRLQMILRKQNLREEEEHEFNLKVNLFYT